MKRVAVAVLVASATGATLAGCGTSDEPTMTGAQARQQTEQRIREAVRTFAPDARFRVTTDRMVSCEGMSKDATGQLRTELTYRVTTSTNVDEDFGAFDRWLKAQHASEYSDARPGALLLSGRVRGIKVSMQSTRSGLELYGHSECVWPRGKPS